MNAYESTGKTVEEAISEGLKRLGLSIGEVQVDILEEGSKGLFGLFGSKEARVRLTVKEEERTESLFADSLDSYDAAARASERPAAKREPKEARGGAESGARPEKAPKTERAPKGEKLRPAPAPKPRAELPEKPEKPEGGERGKAERRPKAERPPKPARPQRSAEPPAPAEPRDPATDEGRVQSFLQELTRLMGLEVSVNVNTDEEGNIRVSMMGDPQGILIGRRGETLDALQYLTSLHLNRGREEYRRVTLDSEGYRAKREDALVRLANRMANRAQRTGRKVSLEPMNPYERRILHSALQGHEGISTHSEGEEPNRHVVITVSRSASPRQEEEGAGEE